MPKTVATPLDSYSCHDARVDSLDCNSLGTRRSNIAPDDASTTPYKKKPTHAAWPENLRDQPFEHAPGAASAYARAKILRETSADGSS
jgi:hypothetical protein